MSAVVAGNGRVSVVRCDDFADKRVSHYVFRFEVGECDVVNAVKDAFDGGEPGFRYCQIDLRHVAGDNHFRIEA